MDDNTSEAMSDPISESSYLQSFPTDVREEALKHAMDIRKFEIDLYWKRAAYFWAFIGASLAGYGAVRASATVATSDKRDLSVLLSCLGAIFSFGWYCVNRGSKQWQENWENHVDMLEDGVIGPLYKTVLRRPKPVTAKEKIDNVLTGPARFSVSRINQIISLYVVALWLGLLVNALGPFSLKAPLNWSYVFLVGMTLLFCGLFLIFGRTHDGSYTHHAFRRKTRISIPADSQQSDAESAQAGR